jgi:predicted DNA-binding antitoxin AbrB/MazE fold protein
MDSIPVTYEGGVFKPQQPVSLPEATAVDVTVHPSAESPLVSSSKAALPPAEDPGKVAQRRAAWAELFARIEADPACQSDGDGWSAADHDAVLYGGPDGPA